MSLDKAPEILAVLDLLNRSLGSHGYDIVDHWEGMLDAVGIASPRDHGVLAYISVDNPGYYVELELPPTPGRDFPYTPAGIFDHLDFESVARVVQEHLGRG